jgi:cellulose synthase/poly-beta-1,6-N-acetylglucosamine synthase-like glycosyltransferase
MAILSTCCIVLTIAYAMLMLLYRIGWSGQRIFRATENFHPHLSISVIIPARNEAANIAACIKSIISQHFPESLLEIIVVDDHSEDATASIATKAGEGRVKVISLKNVLAGKQINSFKKQALATGIEASKGTLIITTDADCIAPPNWLRNIAAIYDQKEAVMVVGPVAFNSSNRIVELFQSLDFMMMQGITVAAHRLKLGSMANGANLGFARQAYNTVGGYEGTTHLASGDDYLLLHKMEGTFPGRVHYLKSDAAIVRTAAQPSWASFFQQRVRWASKSGKYSDYRLTAILALVYLFNVAILALTLNAFRQPQLWPTLFIILAAKILSELLLLYPVARFFEKRRELWLFPLLQPLHIIYIVLAGFLGMKGGYRWKGRSVK